MSEAVEISEERRKAAHALRWRKEDLIDRWMEKVRLLTREKGTEGAAAEEMLREDAHDFVDMVISRLEGQGSEADVAAYYHLILEGREANVRLADVAYLLLELKSVSKQLIFESMGDELESFRVSRLVDDTIEAVLRKSADLYELTAEADQLTARVRLEEIFSAWELEEALVEAQSPAEVCDVLAGTLGEVWELSGVRVRLSGQPDGEARDIVVEPKLPVPAVREQCQYMTDRELAAGGVLSLLESVLRRREAYLCPHVREDMALVNAPELAEAGVASFACVPLISRGTVVGALLLCSAQADELREVDRRRMDDIANVVALALDRTRRLERTRKEISEAEVIARVGRSLLELPTGEELLQGAVEALRAFRDYFDVSLFRVDEPAGQCVLVAESGRGRRYRPEDYRQKLGEGFIGLCAATGETIRASDLDEDERRLIAFQEEEQARTELAVPVKKGEKVLGVVHLLSDRPDDFPDSEVAALENVSPHIGVALQNARMITQRRHDRYEIEQAHQQLANIIRSTAVGITSTDTSGLYTHWSPSCKDLLGYEKDEVVGRKTPAEFAAEPYDLRAALEECVRQGRTSSERVVLRKDGVQRTIRETRVPMGDEEGRHVGFTSYLVDVTEQKRAEEQLRRERDMLNLVVEAMGAGLALFDGERRMLWANATMMDWFGFGRDEFGKPCDDVCRGRYCKRGSCPMQEAKRTGRPQTRITELTLEPGGWRCFQQVCTPVKHGETRFMALTFDITEQRRQTEQMRLINKLTEQVQTTLDLEKVLHMVLTCVTAGHAIGFNRAFIFLLDGEGKRLEGRMAVGPVSETDAHHIWSELDRRDQTIEGLLEQAEPGASDAGLTQKVRTVSVPISQTLDPLVSTLRSRTSAHTGHAEVDQHMNRDVVRTLELEEFVCVPLAVQDRPLGVMLADNKYSRAPIDQEQVELLEMFSGQTSLAIANARAYEQIRRQLAELRQARDRLIEAERMASVGRMASHLAHEIRNPLTAIGGFAASIARRHKDDPRTSRNAQIIYEEVRRLEQTLVNVLDYTRPIRPEKRPSCLNEIIRQTLEQFGDQLEQEQIALRLALAPKLPRVTADPQMIKQVVINLVKNAVEALEDKGGGTLTIATRCRDGQVEVQLSDTGGGMEPGTVEQLFSPFFTTKIGGVGLGLSVSRRIIEQHGGRLEVESTLGVGTSFTFTLDLSEAQAAPPAPERPEQSKITKGE